MLFTNDPVGGGVDKRCIRGLYQVSRPGVDHGAVVGLAVGSQAIR